MEGAARLRQLLKPCYGQDMNHGEEHGTDECPQWHGNANKIQNGLGKPGTHRPGSGNLP